MRQGFRILYMIEISNDSIPGLHRITPDYTGLHPILKECEKYINTTNDKIV